MGAVIHGINEKCCECPTLLLSATTCAGSNCDIQFKQQITLNYAVTCKLGMLSAKTKNTKEKDV